MPENPRIQYIMLNSNALLHSFATERRKLSIYITSAFLSFFILLNHNCLTIHFHRGRIKAVSKSWKRGNKLLRNFDLIWIFELSNTTQTIIGAFLLLIVEHQELPSVEVSIIFSYFYPFVETLNYYYQCLKGSFYQAELIITFQKSYIRPYLLRIANLNFRTSNDNLFKNITYFWVSHDHIRWMYMLLWKYGQIISRVWLSSEDRESTVSFQYNFCNF